MLFSEPKQPIGELQHAEQQNVQPFYAINQELGKMMLSSQELNYHVYLKLLGYIEVNGTLQYIGEPMMTKAGAGTILTFLDSLNTKDTFLTKINDSDVIRIYKDVYTAVDELLLENQMEWKLPSDTSKWREIRALIMYPVYFALRRGENAIEKEFFADTNQTKNIVTQGTQQQFKKGFLSV